MWDLPGPGLEPVSPALAGGFLTTASPGKPGLGFFMVFEANVTLKQISNKEKTSSLTPPP